MVVPPYMMKKLVSTLLLSFASHIHFSVSSKSFVLYNGFYNGNPGSWTPGWFSGVVIFQEQNRADQHFGDETLWSSSRDMAVCQNLVPLVNIKIAGKWMFIPLKMVLIGIDPYPYLEMRLAIPLVFTSQTSLWWSEYSAGIRTWSYTH